MSLISGHEAIAEAVAKGAATAAFNIFNLESILAVADASVSVNAPIFCQISRSAADMYGWSVLADAVQSVAADFKARCVLHLDHGQSQDEIAMALELGFTSIMYDGSSCSLSKNIDVTRKIVEQCRGRGVLVEGEVGAIGTIKDLDMQPVSDVQEVSKFVERTGCDLVAIAIGNAHGFYHGAPALRFDTLRAVAKTISVPTVLHGASGIPDAGVRRCIELGVRKVNYATELRAAFSHGFGLNGADDPRPALRLGRDRMKEFCLQKLRVLGW